MVDTYQNRIYKVAIGDDHIGTAAVYAGSGKSGEIDGPALTAQFNGIGGLAVGSDGTLYVADSWGQRFRAVQPGKDGNLEVVTYGSLKSWGFRDGASGTAQVGNPLTLTIDSSDTLYFTDRLIPAVRKILKGSIMYGSSFNTPGYPEAWHVDQPADQIQGMSYITLAGQGVFDSKGAEGYQDGDGAEAKFNLHTLPNAEGNKVWGGRLSGGF